MSGYTLDGARQDVIGTIKARAASDPEGVYRAAGYTEKLKKSGNNLVGLCPFHSETKPSFAIALTNGSKRGGVWYCQGCKHGGSVIEFYLLRIGKQKIDRESLSDLAGKLGISVGETGEPEQVYRYENAAGEVLFEVCRFPGRKFRQRKPNGDWNLRGVKRVLYRLPELLAAGPGTIVYSTEGEKDADRLAAEGLVATTNSGGAGKGYDEYREAFEGLDIAGVVILPDNDEKGREHAEKVARTLVGLVPWVKIVELPDLPKKGDVSDFLGPAEVAPWDENPPPGAAASSAFSVEDMVNLAHVSAEYEVVEAAEGVEVPAAIATAQNIRAPLIAEAICQADSFARDASEHLYFHSKGVYSDKAGIRIRARTKGQLLAWGRAEDQWSSNKTNEVAAYVSADCPELWESPPLDRLNLLNGILDLETCELTPHSPDFLSPIQLPIIFDKAAECPEYDKMIRLVLPEDCFDTFYEIFAWLMLPQTDSQKALLLLGLSDAGKSTLLQALRGALGTQNCASYSLHELELNRFASSGLLGKLANICPDLPATHLESTSVFKRVTGGDRLQAERKHGHSFDFKPYCRLVFSTNHPPQSSDSSEAFFRRWLVLPFDKAIPDGQKKGREVVDGLLRDPQERSGLLNRALAALPRVRKQGVGETTSMGKAHEEFRKETDPVQVWLDRETIQGAEMMVAKDALRQAFVENCKAEGRPSISAQEFTQSLRRARPKLKESHRRAGTGRSWYWLGVALKAEEGEAE